MDVAQDAEKSPGSHVIAAIARNRNNQTWPRINANVRELEKQISPRRRGDAERAERQHPKKIE